MDEKVYDKLCWYDNRNPDFNSYYWDDESPPTPRNNCYCDNCFYGRDELALKIIELNEYCDNLEHQLDTYRR